MAAALSYLLHEQHALFPLSISTHVHKWYTYTVTHTHAHTVHLETSPLVQNTVIAMPIVLMGYATNKQKKNNK